VQAALDFGTSTTFMSTIAAVCSAHGLEDAALVAAALAEEPYLGSALDVSEALCEVLVGIDEPSKRLALCEALYAVLPSDRGKKRALPEACGTGLDQIVWKREYKSEHQRFVGSYEHEMPGGVLVLQQRPFGPEGFASTVWDSAIVLARHLECQGAAQYEGLNCLELGAGTGLPGLVLACLGARVVLTDLAPNVPLLAENVESNRKTCAAVGKAIRGCSAGSSGGDGSSNKVCKGEAAAAKAAGSARAAELRWGEPLPPALLEGNPAWDLVLATDVLYSHEAVPPLVETLAVLTGGEAAPRPSRTQVLLAAGRNRHASDTFWALAAPLFEIEEVCADELHPEYQCDDVAVWRLRRKSAPQK